MDQSSYLCRSTEIVTTCTAPPFHVTEAVPSSQAVPLKGRANRPLLWGLGGTILSAVGFIALALFEQYNGMISELRGDLKHFNETSGEYVKKESVTKFKEQVKEFVKEIEASKAARTMLERELRACEKSRDDMAHELHLMRERIAYVEGRQAVTPNNSGFQAYK